MEGSGREWESRTEERQKGGKKDETRKKGRGGEGRGEE